MTIFIICYRHVSENAHAFFFAVLLNYASELSNEIQGIKFYLYRSHNCNFKHIMLIEICTNNSF
jgi:hypothetical protein